MNKERKNLLVFGYGLAIILAFIGWRNSAHHGMGILPIILWSFAGLFTVVSLVNVELLKPFYKKWMIGAHFIGNIISAIILSFMFYAVFGIVGIILRVMKKDLMDRKIDKNSKSYWIFREPKPFEKEAYTRQF